MAISFISKDLPLSASPMALEGLINADLVPFGGASLIDVSVTRPEDTNERPRRTVLVVVRDGFSTLLCKVFGGPGQNDDMAQFAAYVAANPSHTALRILDLAESSPGRLAVGRTLVIFSTNDWLGDNEVGRMRLLVGQVTGGNIPAATFAGSPTAKLTAYGIGMAVVIYGDNSIGPTIQVKNPTTAAAQNGSRCYVCQDIINGGFLIFPNNQ
jgi:hypothetical protein